MTPSTPRLPGKTPVFLLTILLCLGLISGCSKLRVSQDFIDTTNFNQYQTYTWRKWSSDIQGSNELRVRQLTRTQLESQGLRQLEADGDTWLDMTLLVQSSQGGNVSFGVGIGLPVGRHGSIGVGSSRINDRGKLTGTLVVDLTDRTTNQLIWRGTAQELPLRQLQGEDYTGLSAALKKLLEQFPPAKSAN